MVQMFIITDVAGAPARHASILGNSTSTLHSRAQRARFRRSHVPPPLAVWQADFFTSMILLQTLLMKL
jgi:hypothetical protein